MDACFLSSNSFTKTMEVLPQIRGKILPCTRGNSIKYRSGRCKVPLSVACSQSGSPSSSSPQDEETPFVNSDWRSFRARLIAQDQILQPVLDQNLTTTPPLPISDKWAHKIPNPEKGCLLIATEKLDGVHIFERTVILILSTGPIGPTGLILNRPSLMSIKETKSSALDLSNAFSDAPLFFGGPLQEGLFLVNPKERNDALTNSGVFDEVMKGVYYGSKESVGCAAEMVKRDVVSVKDFSFFDGYCGWEREQLKGEIKAGYWTVGACSASVVGLAGEGGVGMWEEVLGLMGQKKVW